MNCFSQQMFANQKFVIYSKTASMRYVIGNCEVKPLNNHTFTQDIINCSNVITAGGFQTISEALYLGKKLFVIPIKKQSEQITNAKVLATMGVKTSTELDATEIRTWLDNPNKVQIKFEDDLQKIVAAILNAPQPQNVSLKNDSSANELPIKKGTALRPSQMIEVAKLIAAEEWSQAA